MAQSTNKKTSPKPPTVAELAEQIANDRVNRFVSNNKHYVLNFLRSFSASMFAVTAINLIVLSIFVIWANRTFMDTSHFSKAVAPLIDKPETQKFLTKQTTDIVLQSIRTDELAKLLLPIEDLAQPANVVKPKVRSKVETAIGKVVSSQEFNQLWKTETTKAHASFIKELSGENNDGIIDLSGLVGGILRQLETTELQSVITALQIPVNAGKITLAPNTLANMQKGYTVAQGSALLFAVAAVFFILAASLISLNHLGALRHIAVICLISTGGLAIFLGFPVHVGLGSSETRQTQAAFQDIAKNFVVDLRTMFSIAAICSATVLAIIVYVQLRQTRHKTELHGVPKRLENRKIAAKI